eukprot:TRINITY_DN7829_c0_g2_i3.p1 TRINITY_DN7829_c0_g2~~TRINITY_DN7829_c0_g2_i3.p1  ORF type:complete len:170 (+),score=13.38 TRINITY_DN7829_c0_g2_i3:39-512(+)
MIANAMSLSLRPAKVINYTKFASNRARSTRRGLRELVLNVKSEQTDAGSVGNAVGAVGVAANPLLWWSLFSLKTTGEGLPPGPGGLLGAAEGLSYLLIVGIVGWSVLTKVQTGSGLPSGKFGLLGASEGLSYLTLLAAIVVAALTISEKGSLPGIFG